MTLDYFSAANQIEQTKFLNVAKYKEAWERASEDVIASSCVTPLFIYLYYLTILFFLNILLFKNKKNQLFPFKPLDRI